MPGAKPYTETLVIRMITSRALSSYGGDYLRNMTLFSVGLALGPRVSELVRLRRGDIVDRYGHLKSEVELFQIKTKKNRLVPVGGSLYFRWLPLWLSEMEKQDRIFSGDYLFPGRCKGHLSERTVNRIYDAAHRELGLVGYSSHSTRKSWAVQIYTKIYEANRSGKIACDPFQKLCDLGGWDSYDAARRYIADAVDNRHEIQCSIYPEVRNFLNEKK